MFKTRSYLRDHLTQWCPKWCTRACFAWKYFSKCPLDSLPVILFFKQIVLPNGSQLRNFCCRVIFLMQRHFLTAIAFCPQFFPDHLKGWAPQCCNLWGFSCFDFKWKTLWNRAALALGYPAKGNWEKVRREEKHV